jgi:DNA-binding CsgD family transcriptional regulator
LRNALLTLSHESPILVAIDDVQWLDEPTFEALRFTFRRIENERVGLICAERSDGAGRIAQAFERTGFAPEVLRIGGLSIGALHHMLQVRFGASFSRPALRRIEAESGGNPFIALEIAQSLQRRGVIRVSADTRLVPDTVEALVRERLGELSQDALDVLPVVALLGDATVERVLGLVDASAGLDAAVSAGVLEIEGSRLRFSHPLVAAAVAHSVPPGRRRELHAVLAAALSDPEERARHRALAADGPSAEVAEELEAAALLAAARGATESAAELLELAASLTPREQAETIWRRRLEGADYLSLAGETRGARTLIEELIDSMPPRPERARALTRLAWVREDDFAASIKLLGQALEEASEDRIQRADVQLARSDILAIQGDQAGARAAAVLALEDAEVAGDPALLASSLAQVVMFGWLCDEEIDHARLERALELEREAGALGTRTPPSFVAGVCYLAAGRFDDARSAFESALARAEAEGVEYWRADTLLRLSLTEGRAGNLRKSKELASDGLELAEQLDLEQLTSALLYGLGLATLLLGDANEARGLAERGVELSRRIGDEVYANSNEALIGFVELTLGDYAAASTRLEALWQRTEDLSRRPSYDGVLADTVEALILAGRLEPARAALANLDSPGARPATAARAARCRGLLAAADGDLEAARTALTSALPLHGQVRQPLEHGRTLLALGGVLRRLKQRRAARNALEEAFEVFHRMGARLWAEQARAELGRVSGRVPASDELTESELRVAALVSEGKTNKEVAAALFLSVRGVEATLSRVYRKLGVRSRTELAGSLRERV